MINFIHELKSRYQNIVNSLNLLNEKVNQLDAKLQTIVMDKNSNTQPNPVTETSDENINIIKDDIIERVISNSNNILARVDDVRNRMEFIREEMMFEMRLKTDTLTDKKDFNKINKRTISDDKFLKLGIRKINLGCGHVQPEGYINVDARELPGVDVVTSADDLLFDDNILEEIYAAHLIEHFTELELKRKIFPHWLKKIRPGGKLRLVTPDADSMIRDYIAGEMTFEALRKVTYGAQDYEGDFHYTMFSVNSLKELLINAGFEKIELIEDNRRNGLCREMELVAVKSEV